VGGSQRQDAARSEGDRARSPRGGRGRCRVRRVERAEGGIVRPDAGRSSGAGPSSTDGTPAQTGSAATSRAWTERRPASRGWILAEGRPGGPGPGRPGQHAAVRRPGSRRLPRQWQFRRRSRGGRDIIIDRPVESSARITGWKQFERRPAEAAEARIGPDAREE
jgi:hypothetical protein